MKPTPLLLLSAASLLVGCAINCTEMGCIGSLTLNLDLAQEGTWALQVESDDVFADCEFELPADVGAEIRCDADSEVSLWINEADSGYVGTLSMYNISPEEALLSAYLDGELVEEQTIVPEYSEFYPNGIRCDFGNPCRSAVIDVAL